MTTDHLLETISNALLQGGELLGFQEIFAQRILANGEGELFLAVLGQPYELRIYRIRDQHHELIFNFDPMRSAGVEVKSISSSKSS